MRARTGETRPSRRPIVRRLVALAVAAVLTSTFGVSLVATSADAKPNLRAVAQPTGDAQPSVETQPTTHTGDSADDPAIWVHPTDPSRSTILGNDKGGALEVYDLEGNRLQQLTGGFYGNVDVLSGFESGTGRDDLAVVYRAGIRVFRIDPDTRQLSNVTDNTSGSIPTPAGGEGLCLYRSPTTGISYAFSNSRDGRVTQFALTDNDGDGLVEGTSVRAWALGSEIEGCVADQELGTVYIAEEEVGIWKYGAEPGDPTGTGSRTLVDSVTGSGGNLIPDVEGLTIVYQPNGTGYLLASAQAPFGVDNNYAVYERQGGNAFLRTFRVVDGPGVDGCSHTDGIDARAVDLGPAFPHGVFVCQDDVNSLPGNSGNQNFKLVPLERVVTLDAAPPAEGPPTASIAVQCAGLTCTASGAGSSDPGGSIVSYAWEFGDGSTESGRDVEHTYASGGQRTIRLTVTDDDGLTGTTARTVTVSVGSTAIQFVAQAGSNANTTTHQVTIPAAVRAGDGLVAFFASNTLASITGPTGWQSLGQVNANGSLTQAWRRVATASDAGSAVSVRVASVSKANLVIAAYRGTSTANPVAAVQSAAPTVRETSHVTPSAAVASSASWAVSYWSHKDSATTELTAPSGVTTRATGSQSGSGRVTGLLADSAGPIPSGSYGGLTATAAAASSSASMWTVVLAAGSSTPPSVSFVGQATSNANSSSHRVVVPAGVRAGDGLLLFVASNTDAAQTPPTGWQQLTSVTNTGTLTSAWRRVATAADAGSTVTVATSRASKVSLTLAAYRGTSPSNPVATFVGAGETASRSTHVTPIASVATPSLVLSYWTHKDSASTVLDPPDGLAVRATGTQSGSGRVTTLLADSGTAAPAGSYGGQSATAQANSNGASMWTIVLAGS